MKLKKINLLIKECKKNGTLPFAGIARCAFISTTILRSLLKNKILTENQYNSFFNSIKTISNAINDDYNDLLLKKITKKLFLSKYGHLRPSTYSIKSLNYIEGYKDYFSFKKKNVSRFKEKKFILSEFKKNIINRFLLKHSLKFDSDTLFEFAISSIKERENSKFEFSKYINEIFINLIKIGKKNNIKREHLEYIDINIFKSRNNLIDFKDLKKNIKANIHLNHIHDKIIFPDLIINSKDIFYFEQKNQIGNFITMEEVMGKLIYLDNTEKIVNINNKIILIDNADPGYDFIFSHNIKGLITKYGGPNSHMAIRCLEWKIPSVIGVGENYFNNIKFKKNIYINCKLKKIESIG